MEIMYYIDKGGVIMYILLVLNIIGFTTMIVKFIEFTVAKSKMNLLVEDIYTRLKPHNLEAKQLVGKEILSERMVEYEKGLSTVRIIASVAPLLGLLGTVIGVLGAFDAISKEGLGDPNIFAGGISLALITTVGGLIVAIPHYIGYNYLIGMLDKLEAKIAKNLSMKIYS